MTPKKSAKNTASKRKSMENNPKRTVRKEKSKPNMPLNFKISIPLTTKFTEAGVHTPIIRGRAPPKFKTKLDFLTKIELANSVARQQFIKDDMPHIEIKPMVESLPPKRGRKKKVNVVSNYFQPQIRINNSSECAVTSTAATEPKKNAPIAKPEPTRRMVTRKRLADSTESMASKRQKVETKSEIEITAGKIKVEDIPSTTNPIESNTEPALQLQSLQALDLEPQDTEIQSLLTPKKTKPTTRRTQTIAKKMTKQPMARKKRTVRGKQTATGDSSPSILDRLRKLPKKEPEEDKTKKKKAPRPVDSRTGSISSNSNLSWTKDISSSSTTTCVTVGSRDFVRFNKKLPVIKLTNIDSEIKKRQKDAQETAVLNESDSSSDSSDSDCTECNKEKFSDRLNDSIEVNSLNLSTSSAPTTHHSNILKEPSKDNTPDYVKAAELLSLSMKKIDMEMVNWISSDSQDVNANLEKFKNKMYDLLDMEFGVITHCRNLKQVLDPSRVDDALDETCASEPPEDNNHVENAPIKEVAKDDDSLKHMPLRKLSNISEGNFSNVSNIGTEEESPKQDALAADDRNYQYNDHHDDDDALSLFAESITGMESSRMNTSIASAPIHKARPIEEYVPRPVKEDFAPNTEKQTYCPTKIRTVCEKQNADSTSIYKQSNSTDDAESYQDLNENIDLDTRTSPPEIVKKPRLMETMYDVQPKARSIVFGNVCFYNLMNCCRKMFFGQCRFLHAIPTSAQVKDQLGLLDERLLIQEYLLLRNWTDLRRRYGMCFVEECAKRGLTRILVEMAYDFIVKARNEIEEDTRLRVDTIEITLLHLNDVELCVCDDLLKLSIHSDQTNRTLLCDVFMATMSITQNFTRFKSVFLNLTYFMVDNDRTFNKDVVEHILERVCILPFEVVIARALIEMMRLTKAEIFNNSMIGLFEKQISVNKDVFEEYSMLKSQFALTSLLASSVVEAAPAQAADRDGQLPAPSPDTTDLDNVNKTAEVAPMPVITRTIGMNPPMTFNQVPVSPTNKALDNAGPSRGYNSSDSSNVDDTIPNIRKWRNRAIFPHLLPPRMNVGQSVIRTPVRTQPRAPMRPHTRPALRKPFNHRLVQFRSPANYVNRQPGPQY